MNWKTFCAVAALFSAGACFACFLEDPASSTANPATTIQGAHGSSTDTSVGGGGTTWTQAPGYYPGWTTLPSGDPTKNYTYALAVECPFPVTLNLSFSGFLDADGNEVEEPVTRMCLLYFSTAGKWTILKDIRNPEFKVITDADGQRALFGRHTLTTPLGYSSGQTLPVLLYYRTANYENFPLETVLSSKSPKPLDGTVIAIIPKNNTVPF